jgi:acetylornithine deacetylase/succinyl-diaminopimelate desuccinylase-like protein
MYAMARQKARNRFVSRKAGFGPVEKRCRLDYHRPIMKLDASLRDRLAKSVNRQRLVDTALRLIEIPSRTGEAGAVSDRLAEILTDEGFTVDRPDGGYPAAPAVAVRYATGRTGRTLQFDGHLDTVHLPFVPPRVEGDLLRGSGASDMKAGVAAAVEALRVLRDTDALPGGSVLLTAHDLHEAPWGDGRQLDRLIQDGYVGDAVLIPEPCHSNLPVIGRGNGTWKITIRRQGPPVHEVMRPPGEPNVIAAGAELVRRLIQINDLYADRPDPRCGPATVFVGQIHSGEIYNQYPQECWLQGTVRWLPQMEKRDFENLIRELCASLAEETGTQVACDYMVIRDAFFLDQNDRVLEAFQDAYAATSGEPLPLGFKPFVDDGSAFWSLAKIAAITHGPKAGGQHTLEEWASIDDLERVARVYAMTAAEYCQANA